MDKLFELITKLLPAPLLVGLAAIGVLYFGITPDRTSYTTRYCSQLRPVPV